MGFQPLFNNCPPRKDQTKKKEKVDFFCFEEKGKKSKKLEKGLFPAFLRFVRYKFYSRKLLHFISKTNPKNIPLFVRKGGTFLKSPFRFEYRIQIKILILRRFSFS